MLGDNSECDPPDPISNSEVKLLSANDSVGFLHVKVGHRQAPFTVDVYRLLKRLVILLWLTFFFCPNFGIKTLFFIIMNNVPAVLKNEDLAPNQ